MTSVEGTAVEMTSVEGTAVEMTSVKGTAVEMTAVEGTAVRLEVEVPVTEVRLEGTAEILLEPGQC